MNARFEFGKNFLEISAIPFTTIFEVSVESGGFSGHGECETDIKDFRQFVGDIEKMYLLERNEARLQSIIGFETQVGFKMHRNGHVTVCGKAVDFKHSVEFEFDADQTIFPPFINGLKEILKECELYEQHYKL